MTLKVRHQGALRTISRLSVRVGGRLRQLRTLKVMHDGELRLVANFAPPLSVSVSPNFVSGAAFPLKPQAQVVTTGYATATPSGGRAPYTYSWSGSDANSPTRASTSFTRTVPAESEIEETHTVTVTDSMGTSASASVTAIFSNHSQIG
jgi:hypothetical protein